MKKYILLIASIFLLLLYFNKKTEAFSDISKEAYYAEAVTALAERKIINGFTDGTFRPKEIITRGQVATIVAKTLELKPSSNPSITFNDVPTTHRYYDAITALAERGIINGYPNGDFGVTDPLTRSAAAKILTAVYELKEINTVTSPFTDIHQDRFKKEINTLYGYRVTNGSTATTFSPKLTISRGSFAVLIYKLEKIRQTKPITLTYNQLSASDATVQFEYDSTSDFIAIHQDTVNKKFILTPLQKGATTVLFQTTASNGQKQLQKYEVTVKETNSVLSGSLTKTERIEAARFVFTSDEFSFTPTTVTVKRSNNQQTETVDLKKIGARFELDFYGTGNFIATFTDGTKSARVAMTIKKQNYTLTGTAIFEKAELFLTATELNVNISNSSFTLEKDATNKTPVSIKKEANRLNVSALTTGTTYLLVKTNNKTTRYIIEVVEENGIRIINIYKT